MIKKYISLFPTLTIIVISTLVSNCVNKKKNEEPIKALPENRYNVGILIMDGVFNTELTAPYDIFHHTAFRDGIKPMNVFTVANQLEPITTFEGMKIIPDYNYLEKDIPDIDILVIPSAEHHLDTDLENQTMLEFVRLKSETAEFVVSLCDGAFVLAKSGVLDDYESTTFPGDIETYKNMFPQLAVHENVLFVHHGKFITSAGGAKSFEPALYLCELLYGKQVADSIAKGMVIEWNKDKVKYISVPDEIHSDKD